MPTLRKSFTRNSKHRSMRPEWLLALFCALLAVSFVVSLASGARLLSPVQLWQDVMQGNLESATWRIFFYVRLPRTLAGILAGSALAAAGTLIQAVLNNSLASPNTIGVNSGAGFFTLLAASFFPGQAFLVPLAAFFGALATTLLIYLVAAKTGASRITLVLAGIAVSGILSAGIDAITLLFPDTAVGSAGFMVGGFSGVTVSALQPAAWYILAGLVAACLCGYDLNVLSLGEETARSLGMNVPLLRFVFIVLASLLAGAAVSFAGLLGFVGLMAPHAARRFVGPDHRLLLPAAALLGASFVLLCDSLGRVLFAPFELPVGIIMSFLGGPFFIFLLLRQKRSRLYD